ncbi:MAG: type II toxin-antitoxin system VapC family toxin [Micrococcales bacterium]|nr:type II toxin-antitoxin system VapC family toxin [Micrococcales bacterium]
MVWALDAPERLPGWLRSLLSEMTTGLVVSAASPWELAIKHKHGKLPDVGGLLANWDAFMAKLQVDHLPITRQHALLAGGLDWMHRDPFDRMLAAQSITETMPLVSADRLFDTAPGVRRWWDKPPED